MKQAKVLTEKEFKRVLAVAGDMRHGARNRLALMLSFYAGLRVGEIAHLTIGDVVGAEGKVLDKLHLKPGYTKNGRHRAVQINSKLAKEIGAYHQGLSNLPNRTGEVYPNRLQQPVSPLIASQKRRHFSANSLCQLFNQIYLSAGLDGATSHSGRRGFITKLAHAGISPKVIMELAGHQQLTTTQRYIDVNDEMKREAVEIL